MSKVEQQPHVFLQVVLTVTSLRPSASSDKVCIPEDAEASPHDDDAGTDR